jgi:tripartite-type tricarboxylate transporter receptor subunit TctC
MIARRSLLCTLSAAWCAMLFVSIVAAQPYPTRPVKFIVAFPPGGSTDAGARVIAEYLSRAFAQQVYVENKSGATGTLGTEAAAKSPPDGYTVLIAPDSVTSNPHVFKMNIDVLKDLVPVIQLSRQPIVLAVHHSLGVASLAEFIVLAKQRPGMSYASGAGAGSPQHMVPQWLARIAGLSLEHVPYRGGGQAINDLIAGHIKIGSLGSSPLIPHYKAGTLRLLAQTTEARSPSLPEVPTYQEAGIKGLVLDQWLGVFVPAGTPPAIVARLNTEMNKALADQAIRDNFLLSAQEPVGGSAEQFSGLVREDYEKYGRLVRDLNIKAN